MVTGFLTEKMRKVHWPNGKKFAFTIVDDTDDATFNNIKCIYSYLTELGLRITKTVWPLNVDAGSHYESSETLQDEVYRNFILELRESGHEIAIHGVRGCSSNREMIASGLACYLEIFGKYPRVHINHAQNLDNLYWGNEWIPKWKKWFRTYPEMGTGYGHIENSAYFWGDLARDTIQYVRGYVFNKGNTLEADPYMPYHDPGMPYVNGWFSGSNGDGLSRLLYLTSRENISDLEANHGACIVYTHFGDPFYTENGEVKSELKFNLQELSKRDGWFVPVGQLLDYLGDGKLTRINQVQRAWLDMKYTNDLKKQQ